MIPAQLPTSDMKRLWKETFHDTDAYIDRVFLVWIDKRSSAVKITSDGSLIAMLCAAPFVFTGGFRGLYLHGLATVEQQRRQGIMESLIRQCAERAAAEADFLFLIPASDELRMYYRRLGFIDVPGRRYVHLPKFDVRNADGSTDDALTAFAEMQRCQPPMSILHQSADLQAVADEWCESGGKIYSTAKGSAKSYPNAFVFKKSDAIYAIDDCSLRVLLNAAISENASEKVYLFPSQISMVQSYVPVHCEEYAMLFPLHSGLPSGMHVNLMMD